MQRACVVRGEVCRLLCDAPSLGSHSRIRASLDDAAASARATATDETVSARLGSGSDNDREVLEMLWGDYAHASSAALRIRASDASGDMDEVVRRCGNALDDARAADTPMSPSASRAAASANGSLVQGQQLARAASLMLAEASIHALIDLRRHSQVFCLDQFPHSALSQVVFSCIHVNPSLQSTAERGFKLLYTKLCAAIESENLELRRCVR